jgi:DNA polymerase-1
MYRWCKKIHAVLHSSKKVVARSNPTIFSQSKTTVISSANSTAEFYRSLARKAKSDTKEDTRPHTLLIDGTPIIYRAYYSTPPLTAGENNMSVNAVFGYTRMLLKYVREFKCDYIGVCLDTGKSFRKDLQTDYKATRKPVPDDLKQQFPLVMEATKALNLPCLTKPGFEADDLIATYARIASEQGHRVTIISGDKDMLQLVNSNVRVYNPSTEQSIDENWVKTKYGIMPEQFTHLQALTGDKSDNVPGVMGVTDKVATELIQSFGTIDNLLDSIEKVEPVRIRDKLKIAKDQIVKAFQVVKLVDNVEVPPFESLAYQPPIREQAVPFLERFRFASIIKSLENNVFALNALPKAYDPPTEGVAEVTAIKATRAKAVKVEANVTKTTPATHVETTQSQSYTTTAAQVQSEAPAQPEAEKKPRIKTKKVSSTEPPSDLLNLPIDQAVKESTVLTEMAPSSIIKRAPLLKKRKTPLVKKPATTSGETYIEPVGAENDAESRSVIELLNTEGLDELNEDGDPIIYDDEIFKPQPKVWNRSPKKGSAPVKLEGVSAVMMEPSSTKITTLTKTVEIDPNVVITIDETISPKELRETMEKKMKGVTVVNDKESADRVLEIILANKDRFFACDTEAVDIELKEEGPVGHGKVICFSVYCGEDVNFGNGPRLWVDNLGQAEGTMHYFKEKFFENPEIKKVWHNYGFDRHMIHNHGIDVIGFGGDTMHMGRLWNASRRGTSGYSLESLTHDLLVGRSGKKGMKERFGRRKIKKDGSLGKDVIVPNLAELQRDPLWICEWIDYSTYDTEGTFFLREVLESNLKQMPWQEDKNTTMWDYYQQLWVPFGELLTDIERTGIKVDVNHLREIEPIAIKDKLDREKKFIEWAQKYCPDAKYMNPNSDAQKQQLFFAPCQNVKTHEDMAHEREFDAENTEGYIEPGKKAAKKKRPFVITGFGLTFDETTPAGWPSVGGHILKKLAGNPPDFYGDAKDQFDERGMDGAEACEAIASLVESTSIETILNNFILPLQQLPDEGGRIHASLNLNTETGRLSCRRPNLQNQPAHEKDRYKIRKAFTCEPGNVLVVADYGQLELRLLAHITGCKSMLDAFRQGGDFHSRTAMGMYTEISDAVQSGKVLLEWDKAKGKAPAPLLKDVYAGERRKAKTLNFSIAYGKTVHGLAKDWNVTHEEAQNTLNRWYADRPEVRQWQDKTIRAAHRTGYTRTLLGRYRPLPEILSRNKRFVRHAERAAINTPLQGGAADIVVAAMVKLHSHPRLKELGFKQILQIHDELILEGPEEHAKEALKIVVDVMSNPLEEPLLVDLVVDAKVAKTWYEAK